MTEGDVQLYGSEYELKRFLESGLFKDFLNECDAWKDDATKVLRSHLKNNETAKATAMAGVLDSIEEFKSRMFQESLTVLYENKGKEKDDGEPRD